MERRKIDKRTVITSLIYKFTERLAIKLIGLVISIVLARLLAPEDFGQVAILTVFINLSQTILQSGLNVALVQNKDVTDDDFSTVFYISTLLSCLLIGILYGLAPIISGFYNSDALSLPLRVYSLTLLFGAFNSVQLARIERAMQFKILLWCSLIATILSGSLGIALAYYDAGIWAIIIYYFSNVVINCICMFAAQKWLPGFVFSAERAKVLFSFGWKVLVSALLCSIYNDVRALIIGKKFSSKDLGFYDRGQQFPYIISSTLDASIQSVMLPTLSSAQEKKSRVKEMLKRVVTINALIVIPSMAGLALISEPLIRLLLTDKWIPCVPYMQLMCFAWASISFSSSNLVAIKAIGEAGVYMKLEFVRRFFMLGILAISVFCFDSVIAIAWGFLISMWLDIIIISIPVKRLLDYGFFEMINDTKVTFAASALMCACLVLFSSFDLPLIIKLVTEIIVGIATYSIFCFILKNKAFYYILNEIKRLKNESTENEK